MQLASRNLTLLKHHDNNYITAKLKEFMRLCRGKKYLIGRQNYERFLTKNFLSLVVFLCPVSFLGRFEAIRWTFSSNYI